MSIDILNTEIYFGNGCGCERKTVPNLGLYTDTSYRLCVLENFKQALPSLLEIKVILYHEGFYCTVYRVCTSTHIAVGERHG